MQNSGEANFSGVIGMQALELNVNWQLRLVYLGSAVASMVNFVVVWLLGLPYLPVFYLGSALLSFLLSRRITMRWFLPAYLARFCLVACQSFLSVYVIGDDCGIQLYLLALLLLGNYIRFTKYSRTFQKGFMAAVCAACVICYLISDEVLDYFLTPLVRITEEAEIFFTVLNVTGSLALLIFVSSIFANGYQRIFRTLLQSNDKLQTEAGQDILTGLKNRRGIQPCLERAYRNAQKGVPLTVALADIDYFKRFNDTHGHEAGDIVLQQMGRIVQDQLGSWADACRWGGEEFLFLLPCTLEESVTHLEALRRAVEELAIVYRGATLRVSLTIGAAVAQQGDTVTDLILAADQALYLGKDRGRNQVVSCGSRG